MVKDGSHLDLSCEKLRSVTFSQGQSDILQRVRRKTDWVSQVLLRHGRGEDKSDVKTKKKT